jgi:hypothetical protein
LPSSIRSGLPLRPIVIGLPDVRSPEFAAEAHRQSLLVAESALEHEDQGWIDAISGDITEQDATQ